MQATIEVNQLVKTYPGVTAVNDLSFSVYQGEIFGLLGPNGAGKSSTLSMIEGLRQPDTGDIKVLGFDALTQPIQVKKRIGVQLQSTSLLPDLTALAQVRLFAQLYGHNISKETAVSLLEQVGLAEKSAALPSKMSGGQQQRLALALALVNDPEIIFLDEPTAGLDPQSRRTLWELIKTMQAQGRTVVLTTHYMEEAQALCDRVGIIDHGQLIALDSPQSLIEKYPNCHTLEDVFLHLTGRNIRV